FFKHSPGDIDTVEVNVAREKAQVCTRSYRSFKHAGVGVQLEFAYEIEPVVGFAGEPVIKPLGQIVAGGNAVVECLIFQVGPGDRTDEEGNAFADGIDAACRGVAQIAAGHLKTVTRIRIAK